MRRSRFTEDPGHWFALEWRRKHGNPTATETNGIVTTATIRWQHMSASRHSIWALGDHGMLAAALTQSLLGAVISFFGTFGLRTTMLPPRRLRRFRPTDKPVRAH
ncbi:hypothetical protein [Sphingomonas sp.]|uniref:hypothetical protein n=1 Tax=Sphingomonas sp. TaxID=28214 RepID=UPI003D6D9742